VLRHIVMNRMLWWGKYYAIGTAVKFVITNTYLSAVVVIPLMCWYRKSNLY